MIALIFNIKIMSYLHEAKATSTEWRNRKIHKYSWRHQNSSFFFLLFWQQQGLKPGLHTSVVERTTSQNVRINLE
jgi:hypothetical protein